MLLAGSAIPFAFAKRRAWEGLEAILHLPPPPNLPLRYAQGEGLIFRMISS